MAYAGKGISVLNPNRNDDIVRNDKRIGQERTLNGGRAIQQNVIVGVQGCLIERLPETEKRLMELESVLTVAYTFRLAGIRSSPSYLEGTAAAENESPVKRFATVRGCSYGDTVPRVSDAFP